MSLLSRLAVQAARAYGALSAKGGVSASYLVVAGGGGGGGSRGSGAGAGGYRTSTATLSILNTYTVVVGSGGVGGVGSSTSVSTSGVDSSISGTGLTTITSTGGGRGVSDGVTGTGIAGGSGGGGGASYGGGASPGGAGNTPSTSPSQGNTGGNGLDAASPAGGGGGGSSAVGGNASSAQGGAGGAGTANTISGSSVTYAGGGGGGAYSGSGGAAGSGGGGAGSASTNGTAGTVNTGGGGGGGGNSQSGGAGGSGIVIISYTSATPKFVGGTLTTSGGNQIHTFTSSGTLSPLTPVTASYLVVAGGGGGGSTAGGRAGGGGGAGGLLTSSTTLYSGATYVVTVGAGGASVTSGTNSSLAGTGLTTITSTGGGGGGYDGSLNGLAGGSGGGASAAGTGGTATASPTQGNNGGNGGPASSNYTGGGGGGASAVGGAGASTVAGNGGTGTASSISGTSVTYAGGGGGGSYNGGTAGSGGSGGGGAGFAGNGTGVSGTTNTGGGAGGSGSSGGSYAGAAGGSGTVIISYDGSQVFNGGLVTSSGGNTIHTFNATGALTPLTNNLNNSLRFRSSASAYLSRTPTVAPTSSQKFTQSYWIKKGTAASYYYLYNCAPGDYVRLYFYSDDTLNVEIYIGATNYAITTTQLFRDYSAWYHIVFAVDTTQATAANRVKLYVNGNQITAFSAASYPPQNSTTVANSANAQRIGSYITGSQYFDGYMTDINFIDGQQLEPYYFGNNDAYGNWKPIKYTGMYGTNGFYLTFADASAATAAAIGKDSSPNGNNWTPSGISVTAGVTYDAMTDVPTNTSATVANYAVLNPLRSYSSVTISGGNLNYSASTDGSSVATMGMDSGKYYWEATLTNANVAMIGLNKMTEILYGFVGYSANSYGYFSTNGNKFNNNVSTAYGNSYTNGDVIGIAFDATNGKLFFSKNGTWQNSGDPAAGTNAAFTGLTGDTYVPAVGHGTMAAAMNFGQRPLSYTPPTGFVALNTYNLPTPTILQGNKYMDATLYTGNASSQTVSNGKFYPDLTWFKCRSAAAYHVLFDSIRGASSALYSNVTNTQDTGWTGQSFTSTGFTVSNAYSSETNYNTQTMVGWQWLAGAGSSSSNTNGTITSTVSVNTTAGFSVVNWTGSTSTSAQTVGHGLGVTPSMVILKNRNLVDNWFVWFSGITSTSQNLYLNTTAALTTQASALWGAGMTPTLCGVRPNSFVNTSSDNVIMYCWAEIAGFSKFTSYTGNGSADGPFIFTGFRPKWLMIKRTDSTQNWIIVDTSRDTYNVANKRLLANSSAAEDTGIPNYVDLLSNGFKCRDSNISYNASGGTYIVMAYAENPFKNSNAR